MELRNEKWAKLMSLSKNEREQLTKKAESWVKYINYLPINKQIAKERMQKIYKDQWFTEKEIHEWRYREGWNISKIWPTIFAKKEKDKAKNLRWNAQKEVWELRLKIPYKKCNVCEYWFDERSCDTKDCQCCKCQDPYADLQVCCEYYNDFTEHNEKD